MDHETGVSILSLALIYFNKCIMESGNHDLVYQYTEIFGRYQIWEAADLTHSCFVVLVKPYQYSGIFK